MREHFKQARAVDERSRRWGDWSAVVGMALLFLYLGFASVLSISGRLGETVAFATIALLFGGIFLPGVMVWIRERRRGDIGNVKIPTLRSASFADSIFARKSAPKRPLVCMFQHITLREAAFNPKFGGEECA